MLNFQTNFIFADSTSGPGYDKIEKCGKRLLQRPAEANIKSNARF